MATAAGRTKGSTMLCLQAVPPFGQRYTYCWRYLPIRRRFRRFQDCTAWLISSHSGHQASGRGRMSIMGNDTDVKTM